MSSSLFKAHGRPFVILASTSPRRRELLAATGLSFVVMRPTHGPHGAEIDETPQPGESPPALVSRLSRTKALAVVANLASTPSLLLPPLRGEDFPLVIAADTTVALGEEILGKPADPEEATLMLQRLRVQEHSVYSGLTVAAAGPDAQAGPLLVTRLHHSRVWMRPYTGEEIAAYVASGDPLDKAGAYGIQHETFAPVARWEGCYASIMGLPLGELAAALATLGLVLPGVGQDCRRVTGQPCCQAAL